MINILMVDDHSIVREGLRRIIESTSGINVTAEASTGLEALELIIKEKFDLVILDISMPGQNGLQTLKEIKKYNQCLYCCKEKKIFKNNYIDWTLCK